jgi:predicted DCC family thiol-disulfide oxidoreductase YuxK
VRLVGALDRRHRVTVAPYQRKGVPEAAGLSVEQCERAAWAYAPGGRLYRGAGAVNAALAVATRSRLLLALYGLPGVGWVQDRAYELVARHRGRFPGDTPYCEQHPEECGR